MNDPRSPTSSSTCSIASTVSTGDGTDVNDDGCVRALVPSVLGKEKNRLVSSVRALCGDDCGIAFLPEKNSGVWIEFEGGDVSYPIWVGAYWHQDERPKRVKPVSK
jgi:hypothetical protein